MSCHKLFISIKFFKQWEDFCCKMSQSLYKCNLPAPPPPFLSLGPWLTLPSPPKSATLLEEKLARVGQEGPILPGGTATKAEEQSKV